MLLVLDLKPFEHFYLLGTMSMLKRAAFVGFVLFVLIPLIHAACWSERLRLGVSHCIDKTDKTWHLVGSNWRNSVCEKCTCKTLSMECCDGFPTHMTKGCVMAYNFRTCTYTLTSIDPSVKCSVIGK
ncbi:beta-microseminoprotein-like [Hemibagrus wyckioides]|uniref:beta-microseminoprotein-like n=1 Tax=Hemibagrus wyckioides TaxID=337641 RepID=UPI00266CD6AE|nr:beta-microseminoprotein-like [Hemibagrus wyckioides]